MQLGQPPEPNDIPGQDDAPRLRLAASCPREGVDRALARLLDKPSIMKTVRSLHGTDRWSTPSTLAVAQITVDEISVSSAGLRVHGAQLGTFNGNEGVFANSRDLAAAIHGADHAVALTNGSTSGNQMIAKLLRRRGISVMIAAHSHHSVVNALVDNEVDFCRVSFGYDAEFEAARPVVPTTLRAALARHPATKAVWMTSPTYEGATPIGMQEIADIVHEQCGEDAILIVDAAWGASHAFDPELPPFPTSVGADIAVTSSHKTGGALQGAALLLISTARVDFREVLAVRDDLASTSPSLNILLSIDQSLREMARVGPERLAPTFQEIAELKARAIDRLPGLQVWGPPEGCRGDPGRVTFSVARYDISGYEVRDRLAKLGVAPEKAGLRTITFLCPFQFPKGAAARTAEALAAVVARRAITDPVPPLGDPVLRSSELPLINPGQASRRAAAVGRRVPLQAAVGAVAGQTAELYPPGVSLLIPGFPINHDAISHLLMAKAQGAEIHVPGGFDRKVLTIARRELGPVMNMNMTKTTTASDATPSQIKGVQPRYA